MPKGIGKPRLAKLRGGYKRVERILATCPTINRQRGVPTEEFVARQQLVEAGLKQAGFDAGFVFSNEYYNGESRTSAAIRTWWPTR